MTEPMPPERIDEIKARHAAATEGPWWADESGDCWRLHGVAERIPPQVGGWIPEQVVGKQILKAAKHGTPYAEYWPDAADGAFLTGAWQDVADLLAEVELLRTELDDLRGQNAKTEDNFTSYAETVAMDLAQLRGENARLRAALEEVKTRTVQRDLSRLAREALGEGTPTPAAYINGDSGGGLTLRHTDCDGHIAFVEAGDDFDQLDAQRRAHVCESGGAR